MKLCGKKMSDASTSISMTKIMSKKKFILNDETVKNSYGFRVLTSGISMERFNANPVCLNNHRNDTKDVLGTWVNAEKNGALLTAEPDFDTEDPEGREVVRKVEAGKLKACSIGIMIDPDGLQNLNGDLVVTKCELMEASIVAVPANANAVVLYSQEGEVLSEAEIKMLCLNAQTAKPFENLNTMKIVLSHLQLPEGSTEAAVLEAIKGIEAKLTASETAKTELQAKYDALVKEKEDQLAADFTAELAAAQKDGRIEAAQVDSFKTLNAEQGIAILKGLPKRTPVEGQITNPEASANQYEKLGWEELRKQNKLAALKAEFPDIYEQKFEERFGKKPSK